MLPFEIDGAFVEGLGYRFTGFVNRLLQAERLDQSLPIDKLEVTSRENDPHGGVDATIRDSSGSQAVPSGTTAWQFKRGDLEPAECKAEYLNANFAQETVAAGGSYCLVLGKDINSGKITRRC